MQKNKFCQPATKLVVAAFDFDGTMTTGDSLPHFLKFSSGMFKTIIILFLHLPKFICCLLGLLSRQKVKESLISAFFYGMPIKDLKEKGMLFAKGSLKAILKESAILKLKEHQALGHRCILVSANLDIYLNSFAKEFGFDDCLCSQVDFDSKGSVTGTLRGKNCWGQEKVTKLKELLGDRENYILYAYGDSRGDQEMLEFADYPSYREFKPLYNTHNTICGK